MDTLLAPVVKAHSKAQGVLILVPMSKVNELYAMLNGSTIYLAIDCASGYHHIALSPEAQRNLAFVIPVGKFDFKKVPFVLAQSLANFQQLINEVLKGISFAFDIWMKF